MALVVGACGYAVPQDRIQAYHMQRHIMYYPMYAARKPLISAVRMVTRLPEKRFSFQINTITSRYLYTQQSCTSTCFEFQLLFSRIGASTASLTRIAAPPFAETSPVVAFPRCHARSPVGLPGVQDVGLVHALPLGLLVQHVKQPLDHRRRLLVRRQQRRRHRVDERLEHRCENAGRLTSEPAATVLTASGW